MPHKTTLTTLTEVQNETLC